MNTAPEVVSNQHVSRVWWHRTRDDHPTTVIHPTRGMRQWMVVTVATTVVTAAM